MTTPNIVSFNCRGLGNPLKLTSLIANTDINNDVIAIQETKMKKLKKKHLKILESYDLNYVISPCDKSKAGGLLLLFKAKHNVELVTQNKSFQIIKMSNQATETKMANVYICPSWSISKINEELEDLKLNLESKHLRHIEPCVIVGDLNCFDDVTRNKHPQYAKHKVILKAFEKMGLMDMAVKLENIENTHFAPAQKPSRLDYIFSNVVSQKQEIRTIKTCFSDHRILRLSSKHKAEQGQKIFRMDDTTVDENVKTLKTLISQTNGLTGEQLANDAYLTMKNEISNFLRQASIWRARNNKDRLLKGPDAEAEQNLAKRMLAAVKVKCTDLNEGNLKIVKKYCSDNANNQSNAIKKLKTQKDRIVSSENEIIDEVTKYYSKLYANEPIDEKKQECLITNFKKQISEDERERLTQQITLDEIKNAIDNLNKESAPGPDGLTPKLFQTFKEEFSLMFQKMFEHAADGNNLPMAFNQAFIRLLPKSGDLTTLKNWRPISLINTDSKIFSAVIANRMKSSLREIIHPDQCAYLKGRQMSNATLLLKSLCTNKRMKKTLTLAGLDFSKAFDRVDRSYLLKLIKHVGFPPNIYNMIEQLYKDTRSNVLVNSFITRRIQQERGVKQGCPVSALLFILAIEPLLELLRSSSSLTGIAKGKLKKKIIAYADDVTMLVENEEQLKQAIQTVEDFGKSTQFALNADKTEQFDLNRRNEDQKIKLLGLYLFSNQKSEKQHYQQQLIQESERAKKVCRPSMSMKTKSCVMKAFVMPKIVFHAKASNCDRATWKKVQRNLKQGLHNNRSNQISERLLFQSTNEGGVGFPCVKTYASTSFLMDVWRAVFHNDDHFIALEIKEAVEDEKSYVHSKLKQMKTITKARAITFKREHIEFVTSEGLTKIPATSKAIYAFAIRRQHADFVDERIMKAGSKLQTAPQQLLYTLKAIWRSNKLNPVQRDVFYNFSFNLYRDKVFLHAAGYKSDDDCFLCGASKQTHEHLILDCQKTKQIAETLGIRSMKDLYQQAEQDTWKKVRFVTTLLICSWTDNKQEVEQMIHNFPITTKQVGTVA